MRNIFAKKNVNEACFLKIMPTFAAKFLRKMNMIRTFIAVLLLTIGCVSVQADDYQYLTVSKTTGEVSFEVSNISKITFDANSMVLHLQNGTTQSMPLAELSRMFFAAGPSAISTVSTTQSKIQFSDGMLRATVAPGERLTLYNMKGEQVFSASESGLYDLQSLVKGVYIVKIGKETRKVVNK